MPHQSASQLRAQGYRVTPQRLVILQVLQDSCSHLTPSEIYQRASIKMPGLTEATVYRTLTFLAEQGLVLPAHVGNGQIVYENAEHKHHHIICRSCGHMLEVAHEDLLPLYQKLESSTGYTINSIHVTFFGVCPACQPDDADKKN